MGWRLKTVFFWTGLALVSLVFLPLSLVVWLVTAPFDRQRSVLHRFTCLWLAILTWMNPAWRIHIEGRERIAGNETYVMVANHTSILDILVVARLFVQFKWVSKIENFRVPIVGWLLRMNGYIPLVRGDLGSIRKMLRRCEDALDQGSSIMVFPEGTRSEDGSLQEFLPGAFMVAKSAQRPIAPVVITGTATAVPKGRLSLHGRHDITVRVLDPIRPESFAHLSTRDLTGLTHDVFAEELARSGESGPAAA